MQARKRRNRRRLMSDERGLTTFEYAALFAVILVGALLVWSKLSGGADTQVAKGTDAFSKMLGGTIHDSGSNGLGGDGDVGRIGRTSSPSSGDSSSRAAAPGSGTAPRSRPAPGSTSAPAPGSATDITTGPAGYAVPPPRSTWDRVGSALAKTGQFAAGMVFGGLQAAFPLGSGNLIPSPANSKNFELGRGAGQMVVGTVQAVIGGGMATGGGAATALSAAAIPVTGGGSAIVTAAGASVTTTGVAVAVQGAVNVGAGARTIAHAMGMPDDGSGSGGQTERERRLEELSYDPDRKQAGAKGRAEAEAALGLEDRGEIPGRLRRPDPKAGEAGDFIDAKGQRWDVKAPHNRESLIAKIKADAVAEGRPEPRVNPNHKVKGEHNLETTLKALHRELNVGENVIFDTRNITAAETAELRASAREANLESRVKFYP
jgi:Flp pilus assembly pilin Flp